MERLTEKREGGAWPRKIWSSETIAECLDRLAAIEDILGDEYDLDELKEVVQAKREGRCVVLPCKIGASVWRLYDDCDLPGDCYTKQKCKGCEYRNLFIEEQAFCLSMLGQNGKLNPPYYTTNEEAQDALRREQK